MFCINCGAKVIDGAKFCSNCGANLSVVLEKEQVQEISQSVVTKEQVVEAAFSKIFDIRSAFGEFVHIVGRDAISPKIQNALTERFLSKDPAEKPLLVFDYSGTQLSVGFVITNQRLAWDYEQGVNEIALTDIENVRIEKSGLIMRVISRDNLIYPKIYLTGMKKEVEFIAKFKNLLVTMQKELGFDTDAQQGDETSKLDTNFIVHSCECAQINSTYCEVGKPTILPSSRRYQKAKLYFNIPDEEEIFFIFDGTVLGSCKTGFALCTSGYYYCLGQKNGYLPWEKFALVDVGKCFAGIKIGSQEFTTSTGNETKKILLILESIQEYLR